MNAIRRPVWWLATAVLAVVLTVRVYSHAAPPKRPLNVVFFLVDDLGWTDLGCFGSDFYQTPNIDELAATGMRFTQNYSACNACSPTRGALMTGKYPARTHLTDWIPGWSGQYGDFELLPPKWTRHLEQRHTSLAEALHEVGYTTFHLGKWHLGGPGNLPEDHGFDINIGGSTLLASGRRCPCQTQSSVVRSRCRHEADYERGVRGGANLIFSTSLTMLPSAST